MDAAAPTTPLTGNVANANAIVNSMGNTVRRDPETVAAVVQANDPSIAIAAAAGSAITAKAQAIVAHQTDNTGSTILQHSMNDVNGAVATVTKAAGGIPGISTLMNWASKPIQEIQKDFKFINAVYDKHGVASGLLATLGVVGGA